MDMMNEYSKYRFYRKNLAWIYIMLLTIGTIISLVIPQVEPIQASEPIIIPKEAIRLRILANSDGKKDQEVKALIRDAVNEEINEWVEQLTSIDEARDVIQSNLHEIENIVESILQENNISYSASVDFGEAQFPTKLYGPFLYPAGTYEAIVITLGEGKGTNWWCVLFPPLCFLDFSNSLAVSGQTFDEEDDTFKQEETEEEMVLAANSADNKEEEKEEPLVVDDENEVKVKFFLVELWNNIFNKGKK